MKNLILLIGLTVFSVVSSAFAGGDSLDEIALDSKRVYEDMAAIMTNNACDTNDDCVIMPIGNRACGGPSSYQVYSKTIGAEMISQLEILATQSAELARKANEKNRMMSTCHMIPVPSAACVENQCVTQQSATFGEEIMNSNDGLIQ